MYFQQSLDRGTRSTAGGDLNPYSTVENPGSLRRISFDNIGAFQALVGEFNNNIKRIEKLLSVKISVKGNSLSIDGDQSPVEIAERLIKQLYSLSRESYPIHPADIDQGVKMLTADPAAKIREVLKEVIFTSDNKRPITPKTWNQKQYIQAIQNFRHRIWDRPGRHRKNFSGDGDGNGLVFEKAAQENYSGSSCC